MVRLMQLDVELSKAMLSACCCVGEGNDIRMSQPAKQTAGSVFLLVKSVPDGACNVMQEGLPLACRLRHLCAWRTGLVAAKEEWMKHSRGRLCAKMQGAGAAEMPCG